MAFRAAAALGEGPGISWRRHVWMRSLRLPNSVGFYHPATNTDNFQFHADTSVIIVHSVHVIGFDAAHLLDHAFWIWRK